MNIKRSGRTLVTTSSSVELTRKIEFAVGFRCAPASAYTHTHPLAYTRSSLSPASVRPGRRLLSGFNIPRRHPLGLVAGGGFYGDGLFPGYSCRVRGYSVVLTRPRSDVHADVKRLLRLGRIVRPRDLPSLPRRGDCRLIKQ